jgi:hypothetical protein
MRDYQKEFDAYPVKCVICGSTWVPDARHVEDGQVKDCIPDNLLYLEYKYEESLKRPTPPTKE